MTAQSKMSNVATSKTDSEVRDTGAFPTTNNSNNSGGMADIFAATAAQQTAKKKRPF